MKVHDVCLVLQLWVNNDGDLDPLDVVRAVDLHFVPSKGLVFVIDEDEYEVLRVTCRIASLTITCLVTGDVINVTFDSREEAVEWATAHGWEEQAGDDDGGV